MSRHRLVLYYGLDPLIYALWVGECIDASPKGIDPCQRRLAWTEISQFSVCPSNGLPPDSVGY